MKDPIVGQLVYCRNTGKSGIIRALKPAFTPENFIATLQPVDGGVFFIVNTFYLELLTKDLLETLSKQWQIELDEKIVSIKQHIS
jgi:hypothetical protein